MSNSLVCNIINYAHRQMNWNKITFLLSNRLVLLCACSGLSSCWCILRIGKKFMTVLLKRLMEVRRIFLPSGSFLGTKNKTRKCNILWHWTFKVNSKEFSAKGLYSHLWNFDWFQLLWKSDLYMRFLPRFRQVGLWNDFINRTHLI